MEIRYIHAKKVYSVKIDFSPEMDSDVLRSESLHYKNQLLLFEKLVRSFLEAIYKLAPSIFTITDWPWG
jgi:hypothetical protein